MYKLVVNQMVGTISLAVVLSGCGSVAAGPAVSAASASTRSAQLTGNELAMALVPGASFPHGYQYDASMSYNSGGRFESGRAKYKLATVGCTTFWPNFGQSGFGETAVARRSYSTLVGHDNAQSGGVYDRTAYQFASTGAARSFWQSLRVLVRRCPAFGLIHAIRTNDSATQRLSAVDMPEAETFSLHATDISKDLGELRAEIWFSVAGQDVFEVDALGLDQQIPVGPTLRALMRELIAHVETAGRKMSQRPPR